MTIKKEYLGNNIYAEVRGNDILIKEEYDEEKIFGRWLYLDSNVIDRLEKLIKQVKESKDHSSDLSGEK